MSGWRRVVCAYYVSDEYRVDAGRWKLKMRSVLRYWNYKSALMSAAVRAPLFLLVNLPAGQDAAFAAGATEFWFRFITAGFYGSMTEAFSRLRTPGSTW